ncbi:MAG: acyl-CoA/acyl-ACP dehydrogenase [Chloroflexi bacterium]|nr:acyl-CoA/acyl-ACP dehydrogenase [Chloroflexota bacterium]
MTATESSPATGIFPDYPTLLRKPLSEREARLLERARTHAADFATRADQHDRENSFPFENYAAMKESGYSTMTLDPKYGGEGVNLLELCACQEQLAQGCAGTAIAVNMHIFVLGSMQYDLQASSVLDPMREMFLHMAGQQKVIMSGSFSETGAAGAYLLPQTKARKTEGGWLVNGRKSYNSNLPQAELLGALVHLEDHPDGDHLVAMVAMPKETPGLTTPGAESWDVMGVRASGSWDAVWDNVFVPDAMMPAPQDATRTFTNMASFGAWFSLTLSAVYLGVAQAAVDWVTNYVKSRTPMSEQRPLSHMPGIQYQLGEMIALNEASRAVIRSAAEDWMARPWSPEDGGSKAGVCKYIVTNNNVRVLNLAMDIAGGPGLYRKFGLERLYRDVRAGKAHPPSDVNALEMIGKRQLGIAGDFRPRWG